MKRHGDGAVADVAALGGHADLPQCRTKSISARPVRKCAFVRSHVRWERCKSVGAMSLQGKTLFITGASRGIGLAIALKAAKDGANIVIAAKTAEPNPKLPGTIFTAAEEIEKAGGKALPIVCDIRFEDQVAKAVSAAVEKFGGMDICVNNASAISLTGTLETEMKRFDLMQQINAAAPSWSRNIACRICSRPTIPMC